MADTKISLMPTLGQADVVATTDVVPVVTIGPPNVNKKVTPQALVGASVSNLTQTWNDAGTVFSAVKMNVTDSASNASSTLLDLQVGGASQFKVSKAGVTSVGSTLELGHASDTTLSRSSAGVLAVEGIVVPTVSSTNTLSNKTLASPTITGTISGTPTWGSPQQFSTIELGSGTDTTLSRASAGILAVEGVAVPTISSSDTLSNKTLSSPVLSGTVAGTPTYSGSPTYNARLIVNARNSDFKDENFGGTSTGVWGAARFYADAAYSGIVIQADTSQSASLIRVINSTDTADLAAMSATGSWSVGGVAVPTISSTDTLSNKTLASPVLSGTVTGSPTFSGGVTFSRGTNHEVVVFNQTNPATYNLDVQWQDNGAVRWLQSVRTNSNDDFWTYNIARASADISISAASGVVAMANGVTGQSGAAIPTISSSDTLSNKTLSSPTLSGTVAGSPTFTGALVMSGSVYPIRVSDGGYIRFYNGSSGVDWALGKPDANQLIFYRNGSAWFQFDSNGAPFLNGVAIPTISSTDTLSNKTLSSPTLSGTVGGSPTFSGAIGFSGNVITLSGAGPEFRIAETDAPTNEKDWRFISAGGDLYLQALTENYASATNPIIIQRSGTTIDTILLGASSLQLNGVAVPTISSTDTLSNKTLSSPTLSGTVAGTPSYSSAQNFPFNSTLGDVKGLNGEARIIDDAGFISFYNGAETVRSGYLQITSSGTAILANEVSNANFNITTAGTGVLQANGTKVPTISSTDTLSNKTISSPTLSGTVAGSPTFSGQPIFSNSGAAYKLQSPDTTKTRFVRMADTGNYEQVNNAYTAVIFSVSDTGAILSGGVAVPTISSTDTLSNKTLSSPTLSGTVAGSPTFSGALDFTNSYPVRFNANDSHIRWRDADAGVDEKNMVLYYGGNTLIGYFANDADTLSAQWLNIAKTGYTPTTINFPVGQLQNGGVAVPTISSTDTLTNKTLSSPTLSGTVAGSPTFSGSPIKIGDGTDTVAMTGTVPQLRVQGASFSTGITVRRDGNAEVGIQSTGTGNIGTWTAHNVQFMRNGSAMGGFDANAIFIGQVNNPRFYLYNNAGTASTLTLGADSADTFLGSFTNAPFGIYTNSTKRINIPAAGGFELIDGNNILIGTTTGTKIGTSTSQKLGFFNKTPVVQPTAVADATDAASVITQLNALLSRMRDLGLIAT